MLTPFEIVPGPPKGFRKAIPVAVKIDVIIRQEGRCAACNQLLLSYATTDFDHTPAIQLRAWSDEDQDTIPPSNSVEHIEAKHADCHDAKTFGHRSSAASKRGTDITEIARLKSLTKSEMAFRQRLLAKSGESPVEAPMRPKRQWPKRSFQRRRVNESR